MSLRITNNISAMSAHRFLTANDANMSKAIERLSSGLRINGAADDAAGLVISESLRTTISGMEQATRNTQDAVNMFKTTEKALDEQEVQLRKIRDLVLHASNNVGNSEALAADQAEIDQAVSAIDRIATSTKFAGISLLNTGTANIEDRYFQIGQESGERIQFSLPTTFAGTAISADATALTLGLTQSSGGSGPTVTGAAYAAGAADNFKFVDVKWTRADGTEYHVVSTFAADSADDDAAVTAINADINAAIGANTTNDAHASGIFKAEAGAGASAGMIVFRATTLNTADQSASANIEVVSWATDGSVTGFENAKTDAGVANSTRVLDVESGSANFTTYLNTVDAALKKVNGLRVNLGAFQKNNLESNLSRLAVAKENLQASESAIRDTDMAAEMVNFTKSQILMQAGQSMMSQANFAPQSLLQMLRG